MKKLISILAVLALCATLCVGYAAAEADDGLTAARDYLRLMYQNRTETTPADYEVVGVVISAASSMTLSGPPIPTPSRFSRR